MLIQIDKDITTLKENMLLLFKFNLFMQARNTWSNKYFKYLKYKVLKRQKK